ncbi:MULTISPECIES: 3-hydroxybutyrate dehydrogenase [unclassified Sporosarcina]|uniref:3-hydroxybutyrate dehydrogenase n=1 Tax=unclassified Sporosarcina TaxID=2647733 RepID=UPI000C16DD9A|nr:MULTISPECIES: 3-hydroxybutyrate dehydrogenase [unclassified Sporosarcina]PID05029.1 3-hydroxybutyrate dehydrogenase [Sporosarcina sp. P30]PID08029.1 3-hydroxybutyrate dehydrogenase [Sporosarcina sp. P31]PID11783.1 3-hydroxybutyrate dehydrogenase [Sporosarcina sp. P32b]
MVKDKVLLITGAAQGIGFEISKAFAEAGSIVVLTDVNEEKVKEAAVTLGGGAIGLKCDVTKEQDIQQAIDETISHFGRIDILINNAGLQHVAKLEDFPTARFELLVKVMLTAPFIATKLVLPHMKKQQFGRILNMASINGLVGFAGKAAYNSSKHGVIGLTKVAALETAADGITVNAICPGYVDTPLVRNQFEDLAEVRGVPLESVLEEIIYPLVPQKRLLDVKEVADLALYLSSNSAKGITGQAIVLDGGYTVQ